MGGPFTPVTGGNPLLQPPPLTSPFNPSSPTTAFGTDFGAGVNSGANNVIGQAGEIAQQSGSSGDTRDQAASLIDYYNQQLAIATGPPPSGPQFANIQDALAEIYTPEWRSYLGAQEYVDYMDSRDFDPATGTFGGGNGRGGADNTASFLNDARLREFEETRKREFQQQFEEAQRQAAAEEEFRRQQQELDSIFGLLEGQISRGQLQESEATRRLTGAVQSADIQRQTLRDQGGKNLPAGTQHFPNLGPGSDFAKTFESITGRPFQGMSTLGTFGVNPTAVTTPITQAGNAPGGSGMLGGSLAAAAQQLAAQGYSTDAINAVIGSQAGPGVGFGTILGAPTGAPPPTPSPQAPRLSPPSNPMTAALMGFGR